VEKYLKGLKMAATTNSKMQELMKKLAYTAIMLAVYRVATQVPTPGVDGQALLSFFENMKGSIFSVFNTFSGGALQRFSVLALGIMPYITSSIIFSLLAVSIPKLAEKQKEAGGHKIIAQWTRYMTVLICIVQGFGLAVGLESIKSQAGTQVVLDPGMEFRLLTVITLTAGTMFLMWVGEQITEKGIGNGISLIIFAGIAAGIPSGFLNTINLFKNGELTMLKLIIVGFIMFGTFWLIVYVERAMRKIPIQFAKKVVNNRVYGGQSSHLPVKINISGVIPPIFASSVLAFPSTLANMIQEGSFLFPYVNLIKDAIAPGAFLYNLMFVGFIVFFCFFYTSIQFKTGDIAENLKKNGGFIPGIRPGAKTVEFLDYVAERLTLVGSFYLSIICIVPTILLGYANVPFYFGGTSLLILVGVAIDMTEQISSFMISQRYDNVYKARGKHSGARRF
jgi:preprotein translocase subunit SecY